MPLRYEHVRVNKETPSKFQCDLQCAQCRGKRKDGEDCRRRVCMWLPYCWQHTRSELGLRVAASTHVPGTLGLFAAKDFEEAEMVAPYVGERIDARTRKGRYDEGPLTLAPYLIATSDSACVRGIGAASNGAFGIVPEESANVEFYETTNQHGVVKEAGTSYGGLFLSRNNLGYKYWSWATRDIQRGDEIIANYHGVGGYGRQFEAREARCAEMGVTCDRTRRR